MIKVRQTCKPYSYEHLVRSSASKKMKKVTIWNWKLKRSPVLSMKYYWNKKTLNRLCLPWKREWYFYSHAPAAKLGNLVSGMRWIRNREQSGSGHHQDGRQDNTQKRTILESWILSLLEIALVFARVNFPNAYSILRNLISLVAVLLAVQCCKLL